MVGAPDATLSRLTVPRYYRVRLCHRSVPDHPRGRGLPGRPTPCSTREGPTRRTGTDARGDSTRRDAVSPGPDTVTLSTVVTRRGDPPSVSEVRPRPTRHTTGVVAPLAPSVSRQSYARPPVNSSLAGTPVVPGFTCVPPLFVPVLTSVVARPDLVPHVPPRAPPSSRVTGRPRVGVGTRTFPESMSGRPFEDK